MPPNLTNDGMRNSVFSPNPSYLGHRFWTPGLHGPSLAVPHAGGRGEPAPAAAAAVPSAGEVCVLVPAFLPHGLQLVLVAGTRACKGSTERKLDF